MAGVRSARRFTVAVAVLLAIQIVTSFGAVVLLGRMTPAIERILQENVASVEAVESMLASLAEIRAGIDDERTKKSFGEAFRRARSNVTEQSETVVVERLERAVPLALSGDPEAIGAAVSALRELGAINRRAMDEADLRAKRIGRAGAWAAVFLAALGLVASGLTVRRLERDLLAPLAELSDVVVAHGSGDRHRRCAKVHHKGEFAPVMQVLNDIFDDHEQADSSARAPQDLDRTLAVALLDQQPDATLVVDEQGEIRVANQPALDRLSGPDGERLRRELAEIPSKRGQVLGPRVQQLPGRPQWLVVLGDS